MDFQRRSHDEAAHGAYLAALRWPDGFRCPPCGHDRAWPLKTKPWTHECRACRRPTSVKAGTILHGSKLALAIWFWAAYLMATHSNGISAPQLQKQIGLGSYKSAWLLCAKPRAAMVAPGCNPLSGLVEIDETMIRHRTREAPPAGGQGRSHDGKLLIAVADDLDGDGPLDDPGRIRHATFQSLLGLSPTRCRSHRRQRDKPLRIFK